MSTIIHNTVRLTVCFAVLTSFASGLFAQDKITAEQEKFFETKIRPVLIRECYSCHSSKSQIKGGLWLDTREGTHAGGDSGPAIVPGDLEESLLFNAINHIDYNMPPRKKLSDEIIEDFRQWIEMGAPDPRVQEIQKVNSTISEADIEQGREFWSFKAPKQADVPTDSSEWAKTDVDRFVVRHLNEKGLKPAADTDPNTFIRRLSFDLIGLPPSPKQIAWFLEKWEQDPDMAVEKVVDALLARDEFGERWGRHWLDVARYAESSGKEMNITYPHAWRYRDYVIDSFNKDKPYDEFLAEQIAGDLLPAKNDREWTEHLIATGFLAIGPKTLTEQNGRQFELDLIDEQLDVTTRVMLGVSVACARCHDHKFDPIPQTDYYALSGIFKSTNTHYGTMSTFQNRRPSNLLILPVDNPSHFDDSISQEELAKLKQELAKAREDLRQAQRERRQARQNSDGGSSAQRSIVSIARLSGLVGALETRIGSYDDDGNPRSYCMGVQSKDEPVNARLLIRGEFDQPSEVIDRGFPQVLTKKQPRIKPRNSGRLEFARWVGSRSNPLTARVMVNRIWLHMFGNGLVRTPENFGATGLPPTHPELLDHLALQFMENDWSVKLVIRELATSRIYRTSSKYNAEAFEVDPENKLVWRMEPRRLDAEVIRDSILKISGELDAARPRGSLVAMVGPAVVRDGEILSPSASKSAQQIGMMNSPMAGRLRDAASRSGNPLVRNLANGARVEIEQKNQSRSIYLPIVRDNIPRSLDVFDFAESSMVIGKRETSNTPGQGLYFLNNPFVIAQSDAMARRLLKEGKSVRERVNQAFLLAYGRSPTKSEMDAVKKFYDEFEMSGRQAEDPVRILSAICQSILASAEFRFVN